tara:strand:- start:138 stop:311 length:174 start_codon:yes stop_codon:yes gene_type:complete
MSAVDKAYKQVYSSKTPTSRVVLDSLKVGKLGFMESAYAEANWIILGDNPISAQELG